MMIRCIVDVEKDVGMKKLSQEEAAKVLEGMKVKIEIPKAAVTQWKRNTALDMAIEALKYSEAPNSSDCISRQAAIENSFEVYTKEYGWCEVVGVDVISELPSAQPEPEIYWGYTPTYERPLADVEIVSRLRAIQRQIAGRDYAIDRAIEIIEAVAERRTDE